MSYTKLEKKIESTFQDLVLFILIYYFW